MVSVCAELTLRIFPFKPHVIVARTKRQTPDFLQNFSGIAEKMQAKDEVADLRFQVERGQHSTTPLEKIQKRESDTRPVNPTHVEDLVNSIAVLGLIEPVVTDMESVLLAGAHRLAAIKRLQQNNPDAFEKHFPNGMIPVRIMPFAANDEPERALQIEIAENEQRRDYTPAEVRSIADHLMATGYEDVKGRPPRGAKPLMPALSLVIGKNRRTIQRYLHGGSQRKSQTPVQLLERASKALRTWQKNIPSDKASQELHQRLPELLSLIDAALGNTKSQ